MNPWDMYQSRMKSTGTTKRDTLLRRERRYLSEKLPEVLSNFTVNIDGKSQNIEVVNTDDMYEKAIYSMPGEDIAPGSLVEWMDNYWLVVEKDLATEVYTRAKMIRCNYLLRWVDNDGVIREQWCIVEDGTKYLTGQYEDRDFFVTRGDSRICMTIARNKHTIKMKRGCRFLIDDVESETMTAYEITKPFKIGDILDGHGVFRFILQEVNTTADDNQELRVADYYKQFPREDTWKTAPDMSIDPDNNRTDDGRKVWI